MSKSLNDNLYEIRNHLVKEITSLFARTTTHSTNKRDKITFRCEALNVRL